MKRSPALVVVVAVILAACTSPSSSPSSFTVDEPSATSPEEVTGVLAALEPVGSCDALLEYFIEQALAQVGPYGLDRWGGPIIAEAVAETTAADSAGDGGQTPGDADPTSTNVQVEGVDEGDMVKASGDHLYVLANQRLVTFSTAGGGIEELGSIHLGSDFGGGEMLLHGDRLAIVNMGWDVRPLADTAIDIAPMGSGFTRVTLIDVSDPGDPSMIGRLTFDGSVVTTRMVEGHLRVVVEAHPVGLAWSYPEGSGLRAEREATERNREIVRNSTIENWLPYYVSDGEDEGLLLACEDVLVPPEPSGVGTLSILDFDLESGIETWEAASVVASGSTVYANIERTYVATQRWIDPVAVDSREEFRGHVTRIHRFDTPVDREMTYVASGDVDGFLLNQFAMDEYEDHLRVASTTAPEWWGGGGPSESRVTVLATRGNRLERVGEVGGLGKTETIRAVRFMGPVGYVVTFRQTDPLYVIDLSDPASPVAAGELEIPGFSAYLHPVADGRLLGVGQDADPETGATEGLQVSLFDVSDPTAPTRLDTFSPRPVDEGEDFHIGSPVEWDHRAFTRAGDTAFVPFEGWSWAERGGESFTSGVIAVEWEGDTLDASRVLSISDGKPRNDRWGLSPQRVVVRGDVLYAVGYNGISVIDLESGEVTDSVRY